MGLVHDHARILFPMLAGRTDFELVGIVETDPSLIGYYSDRYHLSRSLFVGDLDALLRSQKVDAVATFTTTADHRKVVEVCAAHRVDVMMEKPLSVGLADARAIAAASARSGIRVLVNYETTWYPANRSAYDLVASQRTMGGIRKIVVRDGHQGPAAIGVSPQFLGWLEDPKRGGGALLDFGCYGADLVTWISQCERPTSVTAVCQNLQPSTYTRVEDESTLVLTYTHFQAIIEASWNWPSGRKDMDIYCDGGAIYQIDRDHLERKVASSERAETVQTPPLSGPDSDSLSYLAAVVRREVEPDGPSSLKVNLIVAEILNAAKESAATGRRIALPKYTGN